MALNYLKKHWRPELRAQKLGSWIKYKGVLYTQTEFVSIFGLSKKFDENDEVDFEFPIPEQTLAEGRKIIETMVWEKKDPVVIVNALRRMYLFEEKIRREIEALGKIQRS